MPGGNKHGASHAVFAADASSETSPAGPAHGRCTDADDGAELNAADPDTGNGRSATLALLVGASGIEHF